MILAAAAAPAPVAPAALGNYPQSPSQHLPRELHNPGWHCRTDPPAEEVGCKTAVPAAVGSLTGRIAGFGSRMREERQGR